MGTSARSDDDNIGLNLLIGVGLCVVLALIYAPFLWLAGQFGVLWSLAKGALALIVSAFVLVYSLYGVARGIAAVSGGRYDAEGVQFPLNILAAVACALFTTAHVVNATAAATSAASTWLTIVLHILGFFAFYVGYALWSIAFIGGAYRTLSGLTAIISYIVFAFWPTGAAGLLRLVHLA